MPDFNLPLSGAVSEAFKIWAPFFSPIGNQFGLFNINLGKSSDPSVEADVIADVASYGKQLGRIEDVLSILVTRLEAGRSSLNEADQDAVDAFKRMAKDIAAIKKRRRPRGG